jgi:hypothetical protein
VALNRLLSTLALAALLGGSAWLAQDAQANFADSAGFSGRGGATCIACHTLAPAPLTPPPAAAVIEGLPAAWDPGQAYALTLRVEGGPSALPAPAPQGGFDLSLDAGTLSFPPEMDGLLRNPNAQEVTYLPEGTMRREWQVVWTAPGLEQRPRPVQLWMAVVSADGNHVVALNASDGGERFDAVDAIAFALPASSAAEAAWRALPLLPPAAEAASTELRTIVAGRHADGNATHIAWRLDGGQWTVREAGAEWRVRLDGLEAGPHTFAVRSEGADRASPETTVRFDVPGFAIDLPGGKDTPAPPAPLLLLCLLALAVVALRSRR